MTPEDRKYYEDLFSMYVTDGWISLIKDLTEHAKQYDSVRNVTDTAPLEFQKGRLNEIDFLLNHEQTMKAAFEVMENEDAIV